MATEKIGSKAVFIGKTTDPPPNEATVGGTVPEPEFIILFFLSGVVFTGCALVALALILVGWWKRSLVLWLVALLPLGIGAVVFAPFFLLAVMWVVSWLLPAAR